MYSLLLILTLIAFGFIAWRSRPLAVALVAATLPLYLLRFFVAGVPMTLLEGLILVLAGVWILRGEWKRVRDVPRLWLLAAGLMLVAAAMATVTSVDRHAALGILKAYFAEPILLFLVAVTTIKTAQEKENVLLAFGFGAAAVSLFAIFQRFTGIAIPIPWDIERRATGVFLYPNALGLYAGPAVVMATIIFFTRSCLCFPEARQTGRRISTTNEVLRSMTPSGKHRIHNVIWAVIAALCFAGILVAKSEAAVAAVLVTLFLSSLVSFRLRRWTIPVVVVALALAFALPSTRSYLVTKITFQDSSERVRLTQWQETWAMLKDRPLLGAGLAGYPVALAPYHTHKEIEIFQYPHTLVFNVWSELGLLGLVALAFLVWTVIASVLRAMRYPPLPEGGSGGVGGVAFVAFAALLEMPLHGLVDVSYFKNDLSTLTWLLLAIICISSTYGRRNDRQTL